MRFLNFAQGATTAAFFIGSALLADSNDALLNLLIKKGVITEAEAAAVTAELDAGDGQEVETTPDTKRIELSAKGDETVQIRFSGRMHFQYDNLRSDYNGRQDSTNHFYFRRLFLGVEVELENGTYAESVFNFADDEFAIDQAFFGHAINQHLDVQVGYQKVPFGLEETDSSARIPTIERSSANRFLANDIDFSSRHAGIHTVGTIGRGFNYALAVVNGAQGEGSRLLGRSEANNDPAVFARVQWESNGLTVGLDGGQQSNNAVTGEDVTAFTGYANYRVTDWNLLGEYFSADMNAAGDARGYALRVAYRIKQFEPVVRFAHLETEDFVIDVPELIRRGPEPGSAFDTIPAGDNELSSFYLGLNYHHSPAVKIMSGYEIADGEAQNGDDYEVDGFRARVQLLW